MGNGRKSQKMKSKDNEESLLKRACTSFGTAVCTNFRRLTHKKSVDLSKADTSKTKVTSIAYRCREQSCQSGEPERTKALTAKQFIKTSDELINGIVEESDRCNTKPVIEQPQSQNVVIKQPTASKNQREWVQSESRSQNEFKNECPLYRDIREKRFAEILKRFEDLSGLTLRELEKRPDIQREIHNWRTEDEKQEKNPKIKEQCERNIKELSMKSQAEECFEEELVGLQHHEKTKVVIEEAEETLEIEEETQNVQNVLKENDCPYPSEQITTNDVYLPNEASHDFIEQGMEYIDHPLVCIDSTPSKKNAEKEECKNEGFTSAPQNLLVEVSFPDETLPSYEEVVGEDDEQPNSQVRQNVAELHSEPNRGSNSESETMAKETYQIVEGTTPNPVLQEESAVANTALGLSTTSVNENDAHTEYPSLQAKVSQIPTKSEVSSRDSDVTAKDSPKSRKRQRSKRQQRLHKDKNSKGKYAKTELPEEHYQQTGYDSGYYADESDISDDSDLQSENGYSEDDESHAEYTSGISSGQEESYSDSSTESDIPPTRTRMSQDSRRGNWQQKRKSYRRRQKDSRVQRRTKKVLSRNSRTEASRASASKRIDNEEPRRRVPMTLREKANAPLKMRKYPMERQYARRTPTYQKDWTTRLSRRRNQKHDFHAFMNFLFSAWLVSDERDNSCTGDYPEEYAGRRSRNTSIHVNDGDFIAEHVHLGGRTKVNKRRCRAKISN